MPNIPSDHTNKHIASSQVEEPTDNAKSPQEVTRKFMPSGKHDQSQFLTQRGGSEVKDYLAVQGKKDSGAVNGSTNTATGLDFFSESTSGAIEDSVAGFLKEKKVGVTFTGLSYPSEEKADFYSVGDNAAEVQVLLSLIDMKLPKVSLFISHDGMFSDDAQYGIVCSKLKMLFPYADLPDLPPWSVRVGGTEIEILAPDSRKRDVDIVFSFDGTIDDIARCSACNAQSIVVVKPYQFGHKGIYNEHIGENGGERTQPWLSHNAIIPQGKGINEKESVYRQVETYLDKAGFNETERSILAKNLEGLAERIKNGRINFSFTYGLHHPEVQNRGGIIKDWVEAVSKLSAEDQRTGVVGVKL